MSNAQYIRSLRQTATYWAPNGADNFGAKTYGNPVTISCRWQDKAELFRGPGNDELTSSSVVYLSSILAIDGFLALGDQTDTSDPRDALRPKQIRQVQQSPDMKNRYEVIKAFL